jgi:ribonuclease PH
MPETRADGRRPDQLRPITITRNWLDHAEGSVLVEYGKTRVLVAASVTVGVPPWRRGSGLGWDGGTRTASITGAYVALADAVSWLRAKGALAGEPLLDSVAAVSVGIVDGIPMLDLCYTEDSTAEVDMNIVVNGAGEFVEVQGTAEHGTFKRATLDALLDLGVAGCADLTRMQAEALAR